MYDRLLKLLEAEGKNQQPEFRRVSSTSMAGGVGSGKKPKDEPFYPTYTASLTRRSSRNKPAGDAIESQRTSTRGAAAPDIHAGRRRPRRSDNQG